MNIRPLTPELQKKANEELGETQQKLEDSLQHLKDWIAKQPHLRARTDDQWLVAYLRGCKYSLERSKEKLDLTYSLRTLAPDLYVLKPSDPKFKEILRLGVMLPLPKVANPSDPRVVLHRACQYDPNKYTPNEIMSVSNAIIKISYLEDDNIVIGGSIFVMDLTGASIAHFTQMTPSLMKKAVLAGQDAAPIRMKASHYLSTPPGFETFFNIAKTFLNEKNKERLFVHGKDFEGLHKYISKDVLPVEYGGNGGSLDDVTDYWVKKVEEYSDWLKEDELLGTDESKRPGKPKTSEEMFGVDGSFRRLELD